MAKSKTTPLPAGIFAITLRVVMQASRVRYGVTPSQEKNAGAFVFSPEWARALARVWCSKSTGTKVKDSGIGIPAS